MIKKFLLSILLFFPLFSFSSTNELKCLTDMAYMETKSSPKKGIEDVIDVMFNRVQSKHFPNTICGNLYKKGQYPWVKNGVKNYNHSLYKKVKSITHKRYDLFISKKWVDNTNGALFFNYNKRKPSSKSYYMFKRHGHYFYGLKF